MEGRAEEGTSVQTTEPTVTEEVIEVTETVEDAETTTQDEPKHETVRETVERARKELEKQSKENLGDKDTGIKAKPEAQGVKKPEPVKADESPDDLVPPNRLSAREKEVFNKLPPELKPAFARMVREHEAKFTNTQKEATRILEENRSIWDAVRPYATSLAERNLTIPQAIAGLLASHAKLTNPETSIQKWLEIGADIGIPEEQLAPFMQGVKAQPQSNSELVELRKQISTLESRLKQQDDLQMQASIAPIIAEGQAVANEMDSQGKYLYPELHDPELVQTRVKPLVSALVEALPTLSYGEALKRAIHTIRGDGSGNFNRLNQTRLPTQQATNTRAQAAAVSVRGRVAPAVGGLSMPDKVPDSPRKTVELAMQMLRRGV